MDKKIHGYLKKIGKRGGDATKRNHSKEYWQELQRKSVESRLKNKAEKSD